MDPSISKLWLGAAGAGGETYWITYLNTSSTNAYAVAIDDSQNIYVSGNSTRAGFSLEACTQKYSKTGDLLWQTSLSSSAAEEFLGVAVDQSGSVYSAGATNGAGSGNYEFLIRSLNTTTGAENWQKTYTDGGSQYFYGAAASKVGAQIAFVGQTSVPGVNVPQIVVVSPSTGNIIFQKRFGTGTGEYFRSCAIDGSGNIYAGGYTSGSPVAGSGAILLMKFNSSGTLLWNRVYDSANFDNSDGGCVVDSSGNVYIVGNSYVSSQPQICLLKFDPSGTLQWQRRFGTAGTAAYAYALGIDGSDNLYITGYHGNATQYVILVKYNSSGVLQWQRSLQGANGEVGRGITADNLGNMYLAGQSITLGGGSNYALFVSKLPNDGSLTGTYGPMTYTATTYGETAGSLSPVTVSFGETATSLGTGSTLTDQPTSFTTTKISI